MQTFDYAAFRAQVVADVRKEFAAATTATGDARDNRPRRVRRKHEAIKGRRIRHVLNTFFPNPEANDNTAPAPAPAQHVLRVRLQLREGRREPDVAADDEAAAEGLYVGVIDAESPTWRDLRMAYPRWTGMIVQRAVEKHGEFDTGPDAIASWQEVVAKAVGDMYNNRSCCA